FQFFDALSSNNGQNLLLQIFSDSAFQQPPYFCLDLIWLLNAPFPLSNLMPLPKTQLARSLPASKRLILKSWLHACNSCRAMKQSVSTLYTKSVLSSRIWLISWFPVLYSCKFWKARMP